MFQRALKGKISSVFDRFLGSKAIRNSKNFTSGSAREQREIDRFQLVDIVCGADENLQIFHFSISGSQDICNSRSK